MVDLNSRGITYPASYAAEPDVCAGCGLRSDDLVDEHRNPTIPFHTVGGSTFCEPCFLAGCDRLLADLAQLDDTEVDDTELEEAPDA